MWAHARRIVVFESACVDVAVPPLARRADSATSSSPMSSPTDDVSHLRAEIARLSAECESLRWEVGHDELTGLPNRRLFSSLAPSKLASAPVAAVMLLDLDGFK